MINGYFIDMDNILNSMFGVLKTNGKAYINVSNSAYAGKICKVDTILSELAEKQGFKVEEIRVARYINSSGKQKLNGKLRESVIVIRK